VLSELRYDNLRAILRDRNPNELNAGRALAAQMGLTKFAQAGQLTLFHARGCEHCSNTGYIGRQCIMEIMPMTDHIRQLVMRHATATELRAAAIEEGMLTMYEHGLRKVAQGIDDAVVPAEREYENPRALVTCLNGGDQLVAGSSRAREVHDEHIRCRRLEYLQGLAGISESAENFELVTRRQQRAETVTHDPWFID